MKTYFYERTAYQLSSEPVPQCFLALDEHFARQFLTEREAFTHPNVILAESVCARMADIELYAFLLQDVRNQHGTGDPDPSQQTSPKSGDKPGRIRDDRLGDGRASSLTRAFAIGYLGACVALLDGCAVTLTQLFYLSLPLAERRLTHANFWHQLVVKQPNVHRRYHALRLFINDVARWQSEIPHRVPPLSILQGREYLGQPLRSEMRVQLVETTDIGLPQMATTAVPLSWIDPVALHQRWRPQLLNLCERICRDLEDGTRTGNFEA